MAGIASGIFYLASPLAAVGHPAVDARVPSAAPPMPAPATIASPMVGDRPAPPPIVADLPTVVRRPSLHEVVSDEVRRQVAAHPDGVPSTPDLADTARQVDFTIADEGGAPDDPDAAVIAAHEERIALLTRRVEAVRAVDAADPTLADLRVRLRRAEAARRIAVARTTLVRVVSMERERVATVAPAAHKAKASNALTRLASARPHPAPPLAASPAPHLVVGYPITEHSVAHRLAAARRSLATARRLLKPPPDRPAVEIAGLWRWSGSESWSLADYPRGIA